MAITIQNGVDGIVCSTCRQHLPVDAYSPSAWTKGSGNCRGCCKEYARKARATPEGREKSRASARRMLATPEGREKSRVSNRKSKRLLWATPEGRDKLRAAIRKYATGSKGRARYIRNAAAKYSAPQMLCPMAVLAPQLAAQVYAECGEDEHIDHILPRMGIGVIGLHVPQNLRPLNPHKNKEKSNGIDQKLVKSLCRQEGIPLHGRILDANDFSAREQEWLAAWRSALAEASYEERKTPIETKFHAVKHRLVNWLAAHPAPGESQCVRAA